MSEYILKRLNGDWFSITENNINIILKPVSIPSKVVKKNPNFTIKVYKENISFVFSENGLSAIFQNGKLSKAKEIEILNEILQNISNILGEEGKFLYCASREYLIKCKNEDNFNNIIEILKNIISNNYKEMKIVEGWGDIRVSIQDFEISFSFEPPGIQVIFENSTINENEEKDLLSEIINNINAETGSELSLIPL